MGQYKKEQMEKAEKEVFVCDLDGDTYPTSELVEKGGMKLCSKCAKGMHNPIKQQDID